MTERILTKRILTYIARSIDKGLNLQRISKGLRKIVNSYEGLSRNERYRLYYEAYSVCRSARSSEDWRKMLALRKNFDAIFITERKIKASMKLREKKRQVRAALKDKDTIFFLCSKHSNPALDHKDYQGKIYVDRYWRQKVSGKDYYAVLSYIKNHKVETVQKIMGPPVYLITRPYCKHYFIPQDTSTVLHSSLKKLLVVKRSKKYSASEYYRIRSEIYNKLNEISPCDAFKNKTKRRG